MHYAHSMPFGASVRSTGGVDFRLWAPGAKRAQLVLSGAPGEAPRPLDAEAGERGWVDLHVPDAGHGTRYQWRIDDEMNVPDPASRSNPQGPHEPSEVIDPAAFDWADDGWRGRPWHEAVIYELHVGTFTPQGTYEAAESRLQALAELGITALELMPLASFPGRYGWGYDGVLLYAPHAAYGTPAQLKHFVQAAHRHGLMVLLDVVYNHFGPDGNYLYRYAPQFDSSRHQTPWGKALNFDGDDAHEVREFMLENALYWLEEYRFDGLRIDAVHAMVDDSSPHIVEALSQRVRAALPDRHVHLILENDSNDARRLGAPGEPGRYEGQWNGDFHHCLHVLATHEDHTYYAEFASQPVQMLARVLTLGFAREGGPDGDSHVLVRHGATSTVPLMNSVNFLQCHDQVGNRAFGERLSALAEPEAMHLAMALLLLAPGVPMVFMGEEFESAAPFLYFSDAPEALRDAIRQGRRAEFQHVPGDADAALHDALPDPCSPLSFERSVIETPGELGPRQLAWQAWCARLLRLRRDELVPLLPGLITGGHEAQRIGHRGLRVRWRFAGGRALEAVMNLGTEHLVLRAADGTRMTDQQELLQVGEQQPGRFGAWSGRWCWGASMSDAAVPHPADRTGAPTPEARGSEAVAGPASTAASGALPALGSALPALGSALIPRSTYRLQFHAGFGFEHATALVPYLQALGISHLYASSYLKARSGSTHGYDIVDHNALNPEVGDAAAFERLCGALQAAGLSQLLDVVPNHMGVLHTDNAWWLDVVENGPASAWGNFFDIDWEPSGSHMSGQVLLPVLGAQYGETLEAGELELVYDTEAQGFRVRYFEHSVPIDPRDYAAVLSALPMPPKASAESRREVQALIDAFGRLPLRSDAQARARAVRQRDQALHKRVLAQLYAQHAWMPKWVAACAAAFDGKPGDPRSHDALDTLISRQAWRLAYWRVASDEVNYRRFFDVSTLAAVRMERPEVFDATHRTLLRWLKEGKLSGLRIDHPDGLAEPARYFDRLQTAFVEARRQAAPEDAPRALYLLIEKILAGHEHWPDGWRVHGDTGYRFSNLVNAVFVDGRSEQAFDRLYAEFTGSRPDYEAELIDAKRHIVFTSLAADLHMLTEAAYRLAQAKRSTRDYTRNGLRSAIVELAAGMPVYRTYIGEDGVHDIDRRHLDWAASLARKRGALSEDATLGYLVSLMTDEASMSEERLRFIRRFQQFSSPVMAKAMEDTAFYRYHRLISLNDVGGEPLQFGIGVNAFHGANKARERHMPNCMLASSTHDSKRSEDVRARIDVLSEMPQAWSEALQRWRELRRRQVTAVESQPELHPNDELLLYQTLVGMWPLGTIDAAGLDDVRQRLQAYLQKALREAKQRSSWTNPDEAYEAVVARCVDQLLAQLEPNPFLSDLRGFVDAIAPYGCANSLNLVAFKLTAPGVPDIYQGCELWNFSLVDPDNRRPVDFDARRELLAGLQAAWSEPGGIAHDVLATWRASLPDGRLKLLVTWRLMQLRARAPRLFERGAYAALDVAGPAADHVIAYARSLAGADGLSTTLTIGSRLLNTLYGAQGASPFSGARDAAWLDTSIVLPDGSAEVWRDVITGRTVTARRDAEGRWLLPVAEALTELPLAQMVPDEG